MKITLPGLCGLIAVTGLLKAGIDHRQWEEQPSPGPVPVAPTGLLPPQDKSAVDRPGMFPHEEVARCEWQKRFGSLRLIKRNIGDGDETVTLRDSRGRTVGRVTGHGVDLELVRDLTGDGIPEVVLRAWDGGPMAISSTTSTPWA